MINKKIYIGQDSKDRTNYFGSGKLIKAAIKKYGIVNFNRTVLDNCLSYEDMQKKEIYWINELNSTNPLVGYNIRLGGEGIIPGTKLDNDHRLSISMGLRITWEDETFKREQLAKMHTSTRNENIGKFFRGRKLSLSNVQALRDRKLNIEKHAATCNKILRTKIERGRLFWKDKLEMLNEVEHSIVYNKFFNEFSIEEISKITSLSSTHIYNILSKAKKRFINE